MLTNAKNNRIKQFVPALMLLLAVTVGFYGCKKDDNTMVTPSNTITDVVVANASFNLLEAAVVRAGLATTLASTGPFTVFAPTDAAFQAAGFPDVASINAAPVATLSSILLYHVVSGSAVAAAAIPAGQTPLATAGMGGTPIYVNKSGTAVSVNGSRVTTADVQASNGVIHIIDKVLLPPAGTVLAVAQADTTLSLLTAAAVRGGAAVTGALGGTTPITVFAPTNAAFRAAGFANVAAINAADVATLTAVLTNHVVAPARIYSPMITTGPVTTFGGGSLTVTLTSTNGVTILSRGNGTNVSNVTTADINATNGVIHKIDRVLLP